MLKNFSFKGFYIYAPLSKNSGSNLVVHKINGDLIDNYTEELLNKTFVLDIDDNNNIYINTENYKTKSLLNSDIYEYKNNKRKIYSYTNFTNLIDEVLKLYKNKNIIRTFNDFMIKSNNITIDQIKLFFEKYKLVFIDVSQTIKLENTNLNEFYIEIDFSLFDDEFNKVKYPNLKAIENFVKENYSEIYNDFINLANNKLLFGDNDNSHVMTYFINAFTHPFDKIDFINFTIKAKLDKQHFLNILKFYTYIDIISKITEI